MRSGCQTKLGAGWLGYELPLEGHINDGPFIALIELNLYTAKKAVQHLIETQVTMTENHAF